MEESREKREERREHMAASSNHGMAQQKVGQTSPRRAEGRKQKQERRERVSSANVRVLNNSNSTDRV